MSDPLEDEIAEALAATGEALRGTMAQQGSTGALGHTEPLDPRYTEMDRKRQAEYEAERATAMQRQQAERDQNLRASAVGLAVQFSAAPGKGGNIHEMLKWADEINDYLVDGSLKGKEA